MCDVKGKSHETRKSDSQTIEVSNSPHCRTNETPWTDTDKTGMRVGKINMPDDFRSSANKAAEKRASEVLKNKIYNEISDVFQAYMF